MWPGFAKGSAQVALADDDGATVLRYTATANVGGKLAQVGSRLVDTAARKLAQDFFKAFQVEMSVSAPDLAVRRGQGATKPDGTAAADESRARPGAQWKPWAAIAICVDHWRCFRERRSVVRIETTGETRVPVGAADDRR